VKNGDRPIRNPFVILREEFDDWAVLFDPDTGSGFGLNPTGVYLWKLFDGQHTIDTLLELVQSQAENVPEEAREHIREIREFVDALAREGLVGPDSNQYRSFCHRDSAPHQPKQISSHAPCPVCEVKPFRYEAPS